MPKRLISVRLEEEELAAVKRAAAADQRPTAAMIRRIISSWLRERGYLADDAPVGTPKQPRRPRRGRP